MPSEPAGGRSSDSVCLYCGRESVRVKPAGLLSTFLLTLDTGNRTFVADAVSDLNRCLHALQTPACAGADLRLLLEFPAAMAQALENAQTFVEEREGFIRQYTSELPVVRRRGEIEK